MRTRTTYVTRAELERLIPRDITGAARAAILSGEFVLDMQDGRVFALATSHPVATTASTPQREQHYGVAPRRHYLGRITI